MGMNTGAASDAEGDIISDINTTPLIDVMLVLLIMLIITIPIQLHAVNLNLPTGNPPPPARPPEVVRIEVQADGRVTWNGEPVAGEAALEARLQATAALPEQPEVHLRPDRAVFDAMVARLVGLDDLSRYPFAEQDFLNEHFSQRWRPLPYVYNALKTLPFQHPALWDAAAVKNVHYIIDKPWQKALDPADRYYELDRLWWDVAG